MNPWEEPCPAPCAAAAGSDSDITELPLAADGGLCRPPRLDWSRQFALPRKQVGRLVHPGGWDNRSGEIRAGSRGGATSSLVVQNSDVLESRACIAPPPHPHPARSLSHSAIGSTRCDSDSGSESNRPGSRRLYPDAPRTGYAPPCNCTAGTSNWRAGRNHLGDPVPPADTRPSPAPARRGGSVPSSCARIRPGRAGPPGCTAGRPGSWR